MYTVSTVREVRSVRSTLYDPNPSPNVADRHCAVQYRQPSVINVRNALISVYYDDMGMSVCLGVLSERVCPEMLDVAACTGPKLYRGAICQSTCLQSLHVVASLGVAIAAAIECVSN